MLVYEKKVNEEGVMKRHLFGTLGNVPADSDVQLTYKDSDGDVITPVENDSYVDGGSSEGVQKISRKSDDKAVNVFIGDKCIIGKVEEKVVTSIAVKTMPTKTSYTVGETLDLAGLVVEASYADGDKKVVTNYTTSPANGAVLAATDTKVDVTFEGKSTSFNITVAPVMNKVANKSKVEEVKDEVEEEE